MDDASAGFDYAYIKRLYHRPRRTGRVKKMRGGWRLAHLGFLLPAGVAVTVVQQKRAYPKLVAWVEEAIEETLAFYRLPRTISISRAPTYSSASTRKSDVAPASWASSPTPPQRRGPLETRPRPSRRNPRKLARSAPLPQHERSQVAQKDHPPPSRLIPAKPSRLC